MSADANTQLDDQTAACRDEVTTDRHDAYIPAPDRPDAEELRWIERERDRRWGR